MKIESIYHYDSRTNVKIDTVSFNRFNVLVGISGAGKTSIIQALLAVVQILKGRSAVSEEWLIKFSDCSSNLIEWSGRYSDESEVDEDGDEYAELLEEKVVLNGKVLLSKSERKITYDGVELPSLDKNKSSIYLLREDLKLSEIHKALDSIIIVDSNSKSYSDPRGIIAINTTLDRRIKNEDEVIKKSINKLSQKYNEMNCRDRIYYAQIYDPKKFSDFEFCFSSIFPEVKKIKPQLISSLIAPGNTAENEFVLLYLELDDDVVVRQGDISSGMFKSMMILSELMFGSSQSSIIIDEVENSLGINCLPDVLEELKMSDNQVIITTHHPRIINNIEPDYWKIVTRNNGVIVANDAAQFATSTSNHDKFIQLINSSIFKGE
jgi:AAA15 family ATPase/GTPase